MAAGCVAAFCDVLRSDEEHASAVSALAAQLRAGPPSALLSLVRDMNAQLTSGDTGMRARAVLLLAEARRSTT